MLFYPPTPGKTGSIPGHLRNLVPDTPQNRILKPSQPTPLSVRERAIRALSKDAPEWKAIRAKVFTDQSWEMPPIQDLYIQGAYFDFGETPSPIPNQKSQVQLPPNSGPTQFMQGGSYPGGIDQISSSAGSLWGNLGVGPLGFDWNINGLSTSNVYVPGYFSKQPPVFGIPEIIPPTQFWRDFMPGLDPFVQTFPTFEDTYRRYRDAAIANLEAKLGVFIVPRVILTDGVERGYRPGVDFDLEEREYDFNAQEFYSWGWTQLRYTPVMSIIQMTMVYPTGQVILALPPSWIKPQMLSGQIRLVPPQGALSQIVLGPGGYLVMLIGGMFTDMPALIFIDYIAGMYPIPANIELAIGMQTAIDIFPVISNMVSQGREEIQSRVEDVEEMERFQSKMLAFGPAITQWRNRVEEIVTQSKGWLFGNTGRRLWSS
jgi:hypothetical protein